MADYVVNEKEGFELTYSAKQREEIEKIRRKYLPKRESKMEQLLKMDQEAEKKGKMISISIGIAGSLLLGIGMCCTMVWNTSLMIFVIGIIVGILGIVLAGVAYPINQKITKREREKIADKVIALTNELSFEE